ncbi:GldL-related protein [Flavobacterium sp.]|uniref:GldL-related protein n=1 Tax=Flavobacterium sp. TaxID=239 RepID=UPI00391BFAD8
MNKTYLAPAIVFLIGMILTIIGALFKIMHWTGANVLLSIGMLSEVLAIITLIITLIKNAK